MQVSATLETNSLAANQSMKVFICTMFLENRYMPEWIEYHRFLGFDFVHLYDNNPTFTSQNLLNKYGDFVRITHLPGGLHWNATEDCYSLYGNNSWWVAEIDSDEFIVLHKHDNIKQLLAEVVPGGGSLSLNWYMFGSNFHKVDNNGSVLERFTARTKTVHPIVKSISFLPDITSINCHNPTLKSGKWQFDTRGRKFRGSENPNGPADVAVVNHYITRSTEECLRKTSHNRSDGNRHPSIYCTHYDRNHVYDSTAWDFFRTKKLETTSK